MSERTTEEKRAYDHWRATQAIEYELSLEEMPAGYSTDVSRIEAEVIDG